MSRRKAPARRPRYILNLLGGGYLGVLQLLTLAGLQDEIRKRYDVPKLRIQDLFDLISGVSIGAANGAAMLAGFTVEECLQIMRGTGKNIFTEGLRHKWGWLTRAGGFSKPMYDVSRLHESMKTVLEKNGELMRLGELGPAKYMCIGVDLRNERPRHFKSWRPEDAELIAWQPVSGSCSADAFFAPTRLDIPDRPFTMIADGGTSGNDPTVDAIAEARKLWPGERIISITVGTGEEMVHRTDEELLEFRKHGAINLLRMGILPGALISRGEARSAHIARTLLPEQDIFRLSAPYVRSAGKMWDASDPADLAIEIDYSNYHARGETMRTFRDVGLSVEPMVAEAIQRGKAYAAA